MASALSPVTANSIFHQMERSAARWGEIAESWVLQADCERSYHFRADSAQIDDLLAVLVQQSLVFGSGSSADD